MSDPTLQQAAAAIKAVPMKNGRRIIAIAGAPASGKSTFAKMLSRQIVQSCVVPMDGFHLDNAVLEPLGLLPKKGAPETFDVAGFIDIIRACRTTPEVAYPTFDRSADRAVEDGGKVTAEDQTILVEGNYLLLDTPPWSALEAEWDYSIHLDVPIETLRARLITRWLDHGHDLEAATARAEGNDLANARIVHDQSRVADLVLK